MDQYVAIRQSAQKQILLYTSNEAQFYDYMTSILKNTWKDDFVI